MTDRSPMTVADYLLGLNAGIDRWLDPIDLAILMATGSAVMDDDGSISITRHVTDNVTAEADAPQGPALRNANVVMSHQLTRAPNGAEGGQR